MDDERRPESAALCNDGEISRDIARRIDAGYHHETFGLVQRLFFDARSKARSREE